MVKRKKIKASKQNKKVIKGYRQSNRYLTGIVLTCSKCSVVIKVNTTRPELYTEEVRKNWVCLNC
jgi:hypothetical protein